MMKLLLAYKENPTDEACVRAYIYYQKHIMLDRLIYEGAQWAKALSLMVLVVRHYRRIKHSARM
jgi:hypothetical protein